MEGGSWRAQPLNVHRRRQWKICSYLAQVRQEPWPPINSRKNLMEMNGQCFRYSCLQSGPFSLLKEGRINLLGKLAFRWIYWNMFMKARHFPISSSDNPCNDWSCNTYTQEANCRARPAYSAWIPGANRCRRRSLVGLPPISRYEQIDPNGFTRRCRRHHKCLRFSRTFRRRAASVYLIWSFFNF